MRIAICLYTKSPSGYDDFRRSSLQLFPSPNSIKKWKTKFAMKEGINPKVYSALHDFLSSQKQSKNDPVYAYLMCDEMKLKNDIYTNCMSGDTIGFVSGHKIVMDIRDDLRALFDTSTSTAKKITKNRILRHLKIKFWLM